MVEAEACSQSQLDDDSGLVPSRNTGSRIGKYEVLTDKKILICAKRMGICYSYVEHYTSLFGVK
jgi:hypothetical protein